jgi:hypothetical protein
MNFLRNVITYYTRESYQGFGSSVFGGLLLIATILLWKLASPLSLLKGLTIPFFVFGLLFGIAGFGDGYASQKALPAKINLYNKEKLEFFKQEAPKVEATHQSWLRIRILWTVVAIAGIALLFTVKKNYWIGVGLGALLMGITGHIEEAISMKFNKKYYHQVIKAAAPANAGTLEKKQQTDPVFYDETIITSPSKHRQFVRRITSTEDTCLTEQLMPADTTPVLVETAPVIISAGKTQPVDSIAFNKPYTELVLPYHRGDIALSSKKKLLDYYHSDLIQKDAVSERSCWFSKKYTD